AIFFSSPINVIAKSFIFDTASIAPSTIAFGAWSPPIASIARFIFKLLHLAVYLTIRNMMHLYSSSSDTYKITQYILSHSLPTCQLLQRLAPFQSPLLQLL